MSDTPFTDSCTYGFTDEDGIHCEAVHADLARTLERERNRYKFEVEVITKERDEARGAIAAQDKRMEAAGKKCGVPFEVFGCDWPDRVADELIAVADDLGSALEREKQWKEESLEQSSLLGMCGKRETRLITERDHYKEALEEISAAIKQTSAKSSMLQEPAKDFIWAIKAWADKKLKEAV